MRADGRGDDRIHNAFGDLPSVPAHGGIGHEVTDIAHKHQAAARQGKLAAVLRGVGAVAFQCARDRLSALLETFGQIAADHAEPVAIGKQLVFRIDGRHRILAIGDRGECRFEIDVGDIGRIAATDRMVGIEHDLDMQAIVLEQAGLVVPAHALRRIGKRDAVILDVGQFGPLLAISQRHGLVHEGLCLGDHCRAAILVISAGPRRRGVERIGAVKRIVEAAPARIGRVEQEARVEDRHHKLRPCHRRDLWIDILGPDGEPARLGHEIADLFEKGAIGARIMRLACSPGVPCIDLGLKILALLQQGAVAGRKLAEQIGETCPEFIRIAAKRRDDFGFDKGSQSRIDFDPCARHVICHGTPLGYSNGDVYPGRSDPTYAASG